MFRDWVPFWTIPALIFFAIGTVWVRLSIVRTTYEISLTEIAIERSRQERERLQLKLMALRSPRRLEVLARTKYGLTQPRMEQVVQMKKLEISGNAP